MGAWGYVVLQNDAAQDSLCDVAHWIEHDLVGFAANPSEENAARLGAAIGLLLQWSPYTFAPENENVYPNLIKALKANQEGTKSLPGKSPEILEQIRLGEGSNLAQRPGVYDAAIDVALLGAEKPNAFPMEKAFALREDELFLHKAAREYVQDLAEKIVNAVVEGFDESEDVISDLSRESEVMGAFGLVLILEPIQIDPLLFKEWKGKSRSSQKAIRNRG